MSNSWPLEALKAQAVAARSYAYYVSNSRNRTTQEHDIVNTTASQVYNGYNASYANCITAVRETANQILQTNSGGNVYACYAASNGGFTEYPVTSGVASSNLAYLPGNVKDDYDLTYALSHTGYSAKITVPKTLGLANLQSSSEQPYKMIRESLTASGINVASITADVPVKSIVLTNPKYSNPNRIYTGADITVTINDDITRDVVLSYAPIIDGTTTRPFVNGILNLSNKSQFKILVVRDNGADWTLASTRYGHGSGLSQVGCYQMAQSGKKYTDMLTFYYLTGTQTKLITKNWPNVGSTVDPVTPTQPTIQTGIVNITSGKLTVRSGPGTTYTALGYLTKAQAVQITGTSGDWYQINYNNASAYVSKQYIKLTSTPATNIGWVKSGSTWKYYASSGSALTGWQKISGTWYYLNTSTGIMASGWQKISGKWYYLGSAESGAMQSGWQKISGNWYYLSGAESGVMQSGWQKISGNWYHLSGAESGVMQSGWQKIAGNWYYLSGAESGVMLTGWQYISGKWYYFATGDSGRMLTGTQKIGGTTYKFNSSGAWIS
jgi:SpoIID/LytB domain protein